MASVAAADGEFDRARRPVASVLGVELDDLLVVAGALEELDARVERPTVSTEADLDAVDRAGAGEKGRSGAGGTGGFGDGWTRPDEPVSPWVGAEG